MISFRRYPSVVAEFELNHTRRRRSLQQMVKCRRRKVEMFAFPQSPWHREDCEIGPERSCHSPHHRARSHRGLVPTQMVKCPPCTGPHSSRGDEGKRHVNSKRLPLPSRESQGYTVSYSWERGWLLTGPARGKPGGGAHANADVQPERGASVVGLLSLQPGVTCFGDPRIRDDYRGGTVNGGRAIRATCCWMGWTERPAERCSAIRFDVTALLASLARPAVPNFECVWRDSPGRPGASMDAKGLHAPIPRVHHRKRRQHILPLAARKPRAHNRPRIDGQRRANQIGRASCRERV